MPPDLTTRLRRWTHAVDAVPASDLMDEAAAEIERLRWRVMTLESAAKYAESRRVAEPLPVFVHGSGTVTPIAYQKNDEKRALWHTIHDAAPAARAPADSCVPRGAVDRDSVGTDKAEPLTRDCGTGDTPPPHATPAEGSAQELGKMT